MALAIKLERTSFGQINCLDYAVAIDLRGANDCTRVKQPCDGIMDIVQSRWPWLALLRCLPKATSAC